MSKGSKCFVNIFLFFLQISSDLLRRLELHLCLNWPIVYDKAQSNVGANLRGWSCTWMAGCSPKIVSCGERSSAINKQKVRLRCGCTGGFSFTHVKVNCVTKPTCWLDDLVGRLWWQSCCGHSSGWRGPEGKRATVSFQWRSHLNSLFLF